MSRGTGRIRIVAGEVGGRLIDVPDGGTRPTSERAREAIFNALVSLGAVDGARAVDLFAGSGALGIEALSRGAVRVDFYDADRRAVAAVTANLDALGLSDRATVTRADGLVVADRVDADLALCDPPYAFDAWDELFAALGRAGVDVVVAESDREIRPPQGWATSKRGRYAGTVVTIAIRRAHAAA